MEEPKGKRQKTCLPICSCHQPVSGSQVKQNYPASVEEAVCGLITLYFELSYRFQSLAEIFEQDNIALPRVSGYFRQVAEEEEQNAKTLIDYQKERGGHYCTKDIKKPRTESVQNICQALALTLRQWKTVATFLEELCTLGKSCTDPHTTSFIRKQLLAPKIQQIKVVSALITNANRLGCTDEGQVSFGEYLIDQLQEELEKPPA
ncbi:ferritin light chain, oocyte isoform-like [Hemiscyllium ocellatum]|uniref:ferritin light chain, oocyte isoform-like n=1 Tax=Hemiscyllium ocellatum TaxID=170820 RepID=UPI0029661D6D|nr:ferritin light chain, oocyte isoform-like [Hemiscyllium ocellatum]